MIKSPFSGNVTQDINTFWSLPWRWLLSTTPQLGFININNMESSDREMEEDIVENVAGYGKQLGRITEALSVLIVEMKKTDLTEAQAAALDAFAEMAERIAEAKAKKGEFSPSPKPHSLEQLLIDIRYYKNNKPEALKKVLEELKDIDLQKSGTTAG